MTSSTKPCWSAEHATSVRIENDLSAALTLNVATALSFPAREWQGIRSALARSVDVHPAHLVHHVVDALARHFGVAGNAHLLAIIAFGDVRRTSSKSSKSKTGQTGPNCSSLKTGRGSRDAGWPGRSNYLS